MKTRDLKGIALDWAVAKAEGLTPTIHMNPFGYYVLPNLPGSYSYEWTYGGPIIERERMMIKNAGSVWVSYDYGQGYFGQGQTPLIAAMRCYVASKLGDEVDVPSELTD